MKKPSTQSKRQTFAEEGRLVAEETYIASQPPSKGRLIGLDCHLGVRAVVLESCHVGKHAKTYADSDKMAAARIALVYLAGKAPCVWVRDALTCERRELLHACQKAVADHTAATNSLKGYLNHFAIRLGSRPLQLERTQHWILKQRDWSLLQQELLGAYFADLEGQAQRRKRLQLLIAQQVWGEPLMLRCMKLLGIGMINDFALLSVIGDVRRFERPEKLVVYLGLNPDQRQSGRAKNIKLGTALANAAAATCAISSSKAPKPCCEWAGAPPWASGAGNSSPAKDNAIPPWPPSPANWWFRPGTCSPETAHRSGARQEPRHQAPETQRHPRQEPQSPTRTPF